MISSYRRCNSFLCAAVIFSLASFYLLFSATPALAKNGSQENGKVVKSFISEDASYNGFVFSASDCINAKNEKDSFIFEDEKITWSAVIRGGLGKYDKSNYVVYWYSPDGALFEKQTPKFLFMDCTALKSSLPIDNNSMENKTGLWKVEVTYKDLVIDNKYFYLSEAGSGEITQDKIDALEGQIVRAEPVGETKEEAEKIRAERLAEGIMSQPVNDEKSKLLSSSRFRVSGEDIEYIKDSNGVMHISHGNGRIYWRGKFRPLVGIASPKIEAHWLTPAKEIFSSSSTSFIPTGDASFSINMSDISEDMLGEWSVVVYVNKEKILEEKFLLENKETMGALVSKQKREEAQDELIKTLLVQQREEEGEETASTRISPSSAEKGPRYVRTMISNRIIYEGQEDIDAEFWSDPVASSDDLKVAGNPSSPDAIAILVYPDASLAPLKETYFFNTIAYERNKDISQKMNKKGIMVTKPTSSPTIAETYGYLVRYDLIAKSYGKCFFTEASDVFSWNRGEFSEEKEAIGSLPENKPFWRDISFLLSSQISDYFAKKGYRVVDLTPARSEFDKMKPLDIAEKVADSFHIRKVLIFPYCAYTKWMVEAVNIRYIYIGLNLCYETYIYNLANDEPTFRFGENIEAIPASAASAVSSKINFYSKGTVKRGLLLPTEEREVLKDGVIDDRWIIEKTLRKLAGYEKGMHDKIKIGGELFEKLTETEH